MKFEIILILINYLFGDGFRLLGRGDGKLNFKKILELKKKLEDRKCIFLTKKYHLFEFSLAI